MNFFSLFKRKLIYKIKKKHNIDLENKNKDSLDALFNYYGSDKAVVLKNTDDQGHGFSKYYVKHLNNFKKKETKILEIGSFAGASAAAFSKYFENSKIYCLDVNISKFNFSSKNIDVFGLDINNKKSLYKVIEKINLKTNSNFFDVIVDDGSHYLSDILNTLNNLFKYLKKGGYYIIEDFKYPNYYNYNRDIDHIFVDEVIKNLQEKKIFHSDVIKDKDQIYLHENIKNIEIYRGNLKNSDICFIEKN